MTVMKAYRFALDPSPTQLRDLERHAGAARFAFNWALSMVRANISQRAAEASYGLSGEDMTPSVGWTLSALRRAWNRAKPQVAPWWADCSKEAYNTGLDGVARALHNFGDSKAGRRRGRRMGFPRYKARRRATPSIRFTTGAIRIESDRHHVRLPRLGVIKTHESTRKLARRLEARTARILSATVRREAGRWYCSFTVEIQRAQRRPLQPLERVGVDVGINNLAVISTGQCVPNPRHLNSALRGLRRAARVVSRRIGPDCESGRPASKRWESARRRLSRLHTRVSNRRKDSLHKLTSMLTATYGTIVVEQLNVAAMQRNRKLARHIADAGFGEIRRQLSYKSGWNGGLLVVAERWFPSSKTCSACQTVKPKLSLAVRTFTCVACGLTIDRDLNAALNLKQYVAGSGPEIRNGRGADQKTEPGSAGGCETSIPHQAAGQDGNRLLATAGCKAANQ